MEDVSSGVGIVGMVSKGTVVTDSVSYSTISERGVLKSLTSIVDFSISL